MKRPLRLTWEQCEERGFHAWGAELVRTGMGWERVCKTCDTGAVQTARRRKAAADARRLARKGADVGL